MSTENAIIIILLMGILCIGVLVLMRLTDAPVTKETEKEIVVESGFPGAFGFPTRLSFGGPYYSHIPVRYVAF